jgi:hypothetical protein
LSFEGTWASNRACLVGTWTLNRACLGLSVGSVSAKPVWSCRLVQSLLVYCVVRPPGLGIPIHPHQHDLMNREERRTGNVCHRRVVKASKIILGRISSGRVEIRGADCTMVRSWKMFSIIIWRKWSRLGGLVSGVSGANGVVSTLRGGGIGVLISRDGAKRAAGVSRGLHPQRSGRSVGRRGVSRGLHPQRSGRSVDRSVGGNRIGRRFSRPVDRSVGRPVGGRVCCFDRYARM